MTKLDIRGIITNYLNDDATSEEISILYEWVKKEDNEEVFKTLVQADFLVNYQNEFWDSEEAFNEFLKGIKGISRKNALPQYLNKHVWQYAAAILVLIACSSYFLVGKFSKVDNTNAVDLNLISLQLGNEGTLSIDAEHDTVILTENSKIVLNHGVLELKNRFEDDKRVTNNILKTPYGKFLKVTLEDGSTVQMNAGSELTYPSSFGNMSKREVFLKGEAFFEITKDNQKPFVVRSGRMITQVYGTIFNISAYEDDADSEVVLVEGTVGVGSEKEYDDQGLKMLKSSQKITTSKDLQKSFFIEDVDVSHYISWTKGIVVFQNTEMSEIIKKLERQFNVRIINKNEKLKELRFTGMFDKESIYSILKTIQAHTNFSYTKKGKIITINKQESQ